MGQWVRPSCKIQKVVGSTFSDSTFEIFAYMKLGRITEPERIIDCISANQWQDAISKYFNL